MTCSPRSPGCVLRSSTSQTNRSAPPQRHVMGQVARAVAKVRVDGLGGADRFVCEVDERSTQPGDLGEQVIEALLSLGHGTTFH